MTIRPVLTIAGADILSGGGLQADLATFAVTKVQGFLVQTCLTVINKGEFSILPVESQVVEAQLASLSNITFAAIKIGLLPNDTIAKSVLEFIKKQPKTPVVLDPVLVFKENQDDLISQMQKRLVDFFPHVQIITPNMKEAAVLTDCFIEQVDDMRQCAQILHHMGAKRVVIKGGGRCSLSEAVDVYYDGNGYQLLTAPLLKRNTNGAGCTFAASLASCLAKGYSYTAAVSYAKQFAYQAISQSNEYGVIQINDKNNFTNDC